MMLASVAHLDRQMQICCGIGYVGLACSWNLSIPSFLYMTIFLVQLSDEGLLLQVSERLTALSGEISTGFFGISSLAISRNVLSTLRVECQRLACHFAATEFLVSVFSGV